MPSRSCCHPSYVVIMVIKNMGDSSIASLDSEQVRLGALKPLYPEQLSENEQFLGQIRFDQQSKLAELPDIWKKVGRDDLFMGI
jgi:hypothetical protein